MEKSNRDMESTSKLGEDAKELLKNVSAAIRSKNAMHRFNIENPELLYQEDESSKLVNLSKFKSSKDSLFKQESNSNTDSSTEQENNKEKIKKQNFLSKIFSYKFAKSNQNSKVLDLTIFALFAISVYLYILSLAGCNDTQTACLVNLNPQFFHNIVIFLSISSIVNSIILFLAIKNAISKLHFVYIFAVFGYLTLIYDTGSDLAHHGAYNRMVFCLLVFVTLLFIYFANFLVYLIKKKYFKLIAFCTIFSLLSVIYISIKISDCSKWNLGLNNKNLLNNLKNDNDKCFISSPQKCWVDFLDGLFDVSWYLQEDCQNFRAGERTELLKYLPQRYKDAFVFGYPITNVWKYVPESFHMPFFYNLMTNFIDVNNPKNNNKTNTYEKNEPEIILRFDEKSHLGKIEMNIKKNLTLIAQRRAKANKIKEEKLRNSNRKITPEAVEKEQIGLVDNVLFIYIDSISRQHFLRKMKQTIGFMEQYFKKIDYANLEQENIIDKSLLIEGEKAISFAENAKNNEDQNKKK